MLWKLLLPTLVMSVAIHETIGTGRVVRQAGGVCSADIVFIVDDSSSVSSSWFGSAKQFILDFLQCFTDQDIGVGVLLFNCVPRSGIPLGMYTAADAGLPAAINLLMRQGGLSRIGLAISFMTATSNFRDGVPKVAVILTDGMSQSDAAGQGMDHYEAQAIAARNAGIDLYAVGIGGSELVDNDVLEAITGSADRVFGTYNPCRVAYSILGNLCASAAPVGCLYNGAIIPVGEEYKPDDCTMCTCHAAGEAPACAIYTCAPPDPPCRNTVKVAGQCCPVCDTDAPEGCWHDSYSSSSAVLIPVGIEYKPDDCTWCNCYTVGERAMCAAVSCAFDFCTNLVRLAGQCCPYCPACCQGCYHGDDFIPVGATFRPDPCTFCGCYRPGEPAICAVADCAVPPCVNLITPPGECCPVCADIGCEHPDGIILPGEPYQVDGCMTCYCGAAGQEPLCATAACLLPPCDTPVQIAGQCCPVCEAPEGCPYNGMIIPLNDSFKPDDCTTCTCSVAGEAPLCIAVSCALPPCPDPVKIAGQCCPTCP
ncbi:PREDICTED: kielin/chordin-like protein isoform X8 [Branchiostoma belcheri]|uniref:Kielin/chordin-like protein isoform X7 n=1 Tax=Branchiostoma belcheri TaxID=7741 RepID=A0A6P4ZZI3_BRABE|nr:PREDICTED: kielin/chordin-like protein isoform X7 [Branchiostoma belcheri]XP_019642389.1 PREDICTED: kielin/chordin-like protein isoform X8 [Branchiostoma belcheri]